jgi:hypothetical protein
MAVVVLGIAWFAVVPLMGETESVGVAASG